jgi:hypothetical protein
MSMTQTIDRARLVVHDEPRPRYPWEGFALILLGLGIAAVAVLGPLLTGIMVLRRRPAGIRSANGSFGTSNPTGRTAHSGSMHRHGGV